MQKLATFLVGLLFGLGLIVSGLINPAKVLGFLDFAGAWDPSLAVTMAGAVLTTAIGYRAVFAYGRPLLETAFHVPPSSTIDARLLVGAALFGVGWGLVGYCPGPVIAALTIAGMPAAVFVSAMLAGMFAARRLSAPPIPSASVR